MCQEIISVDKPKEYNNVGKNSSMLFCADRHNFSDFVCIFQKCQVTNKTGAAGSSAFQYPQPSFVFSS